MSGASLGLSVAGYTAPRSTPFPPTAQTRAAAPFIPGARHLGVNLLGRVVVFVPCAYLSLLLSRGVVRLIGVLWVYPKVVPDVLAWQLHMHSFLFSLPRFFMCLVKF